MDMEILSLLLAHGAVANINAFMEQTGCTLLMLAVRRGLSDVVQLLLSHGADVNIQNPTV
jgi:ankyrin repeat protein